MLKTLITILTISLFSLTTNAGTITLLWNHSARDTDNHLIHIHRWELYFLGQTYRFNTPEPKPVTTDTQNLHYEMKITHPAITPGTRVCFRLAGVAWVLGQELISERSNEKCEVISGSLRAPTIISID